MDIIINETTLISDNIVWDNINNYIDTNVSIIYIGSNATLNDKLLSLHKNREFDKLISLLISFDVFLYVTLNSFLEKK